ncbi:hypothetical protein ACLOJK_031788 [Asimina triloba]
MTHRHHHVRKLHAILIKTGRQNDPLSLRPLLLSCAALSFSYAHSVLSSIPSPHAFAWNTLIRAQVDTPTTASHALHLFVEMRQRAVPPDHYTFPFALKACSRLALLQTGRALHSDATKLGFAASDIFAQNTLVHFYGNCGDVESACRVFVGMPQRDLVSWSAVIDCLASNGLAEDALVAFQEMQVATDVRPDEITMVSVVSAVSSLGALDLGRWVHFYVVRSGFELTVSMGTALLDMYSKCGCIGSAVQVFNEMQERNVLTWTALINGLATHGRSKDALRTFDEMKRSGFWPDYVTFIGVLSACSHGGLVDEGWQIFNSIRSDYGIEPGLDHYGCMVDLLGRAGLLDDCYDFIKRMKITPDSIIWRTLLGACVKHNCVELAECVNKRILELDCNHDGDYVLLSNAYAGAGQWIEKAGKRRSMQERGIGKRPGFSLIEIDGFIHEFVAGDESHPRSKEIHKMLGTVLGHLMAAGYAPDTSNVFFDIEEEEKEKILSYHSEKLAVAFALLEANCGQTIRIVKNLRICHDCHAFMKLVSRIFNREIIVRDRKRFHHFVEGSCSCGDFW